MVERSPLVESSSTSILLEQFEDFASFEDMYIDDDDDGDLLVTPFISSYLHVRHKDVNVTIIQENVEVRIEHQFTN